MIQKAMMWCWLAGLGAREWASERIEFARNDERGSPTLEQVVLTAGLLALAVGLVVAIGAAVSHYQSQIQ